MGGFGSGRRRRNTNMTDCLEIDLKDLNRRKLLRPGEHSFSVKWKRWTETNFKDRCNQEYQAACSLSMRDEHPVLTISYGVRHVGESDDFHHKAALSMISTPCQYGGARWWFVAPCCGRRVRVLYISLKTTIKQMIPECRHCQGLNYASQCASYADRHASYERHLLRNYGLTWAQWEYEAMREHHFNVTPEYLELARRSEMEQQLKMIRLLISCERMWLRTHARTLATIKSEEDRRMYIEHMVQEHGTRHALDVVKLLRYSVELERTVYEVSNAVLDQLALDLADDPLPALPQPEKSESERTPIDLGKMLVMKTALEEKLSQMDKAA